MHGQVKYDQKPVENEAPVLSWRFNKPQGGASSIARHEQDEGLPLTRGGSVGSPLAEARGPAGLSWRDRSQGPSDPPPHPRQGDAVDVTWRSPRPPLDGSNVHDGIRSRSPLAEDRHREDLRWRNGQPQPLKPPGLPIGRHEQPSLVPPPRNSPGDRFVDSVPRLPPSEERYDDIRRAEELSLRASRTPNDVAPSRVPNSLPPQPQPRLTPTEERRETREVADTLSWRSPQTQPQPRDDRRRGEPDGLEHRPQPMGNVGRPSDLSLRLSPRDFRHDDTPEADRLTWRAPPPGLKLVQSPGTRPMAVIRDDRRLEARREVDDPPERLSWRGSQIGTNVQSPNPILSPRDVRLPDGKDPDPALNWRNIQAADRRVEQPRGLSWRKSPTYEGIAAKPAVLSWRAPPPPGPRGAAIAKSPIIVPPERIPDALEPAGLSWRSTDRKPEEIGVSELSWRAANQGRCGEGEMGALRWREK